MKKNILYIIFFMVLVACKREAVFELEGYSGQILAKSVCAIYASDLFPGFGL